MSQQLNQPDEQLQEGTLISHLVELRERLLKAVGAVLLIFICLAPFASDVFELVATPLIEQATLNPASIDGQSTPMIATNVISPFLTPFKTALYVALFLAMPVVIYQLWAFVAPGLYRREKRFAIPLLASSIMLFYLGVAFAYFVLFPLVFAFMREFAPESVAVIPDISSYLDFVIAIFFAFGLAFEVPIATVILIWSGLTTADAVASKRPYVFLGAFILGMFLTPPDVISQTLLAIPVYLLFEVGILMSRIMLPAADAKEGEESADPAA